jgi:hypothetical protein
MNKYRIRNSGPEDSQEIEILLTDEEVKAFIKVAEALNVGTYSLSTYISLELVE